MTGLEVRRELILKSLEFLKSTDDPRRFDAIKLYEKQLAEVESKMKPADIVIKLSPGKFHVINK
jgi:hypothetical protein